MNGPSFRRGPPPRVLNAAVRAELDLPAVSIAPYRWGFACLVVGTACIPLLLAKLWTLAALAILGGIVVFPAVRWFESKEASWREAIYRTGTEVTGRVIDIEPAGSQRRDHLVRIEFFADGKLVQASVIGCPLARKGLSPDDDVVVIYAANAPSRCLVVGRAEREIVDAIFED